MAAPSQVTVIIPLAARKRRLRLVLPHILQAKARVDGIVDVLMPNRLEASRHLQAEGLIVTPTPNAEGKLILCFVLGNLCDKHTEARSVILRGY